MNDRACILSPDPAPRELATFDGAAEVVAPAKPATPMPATPTMSQQLAETREENILLRANLKALAASLQKLADGIGTDLAEAAAHARVEADRKRRF